MKQTLLVIITIVLAGSLAFAEGDAKVGQLGIQTGLVFTRAGLGDVGSVGAKYMITDTIAVRAALGLLIESSEGDSTTLFDLGAGFEYHFGGVGGVSPYAGAQISYSGAAVPVGDNPSQFGLAGVFGAEYFFSSNFSWAGEARLGLRLTDDTVAKTTSVGTLGFAITLTWYVI